MRQWRILPQIFACCSLNRNLAMFHLELDGLQDCLIFDAAFGIERQLIPWLQICRKENSILLELSLQLIVFLWFETLDFLFPLHDQGQRWHLDPSNAKCLFITIPSGIDGIGPGKVHAHKPVCLLTAQTSFIKIPELFVIYDLVKSSFKACIIFRIDEDTIHLPVELQILQDFINQQLPFPIRITGMNHDIRFGQQFLDGHELFPGCRCRFQNPRLGQDWIVCPLLIFFAISFRCS